MQHLETGNRVKFSGDKKWWDVRATDSERYVILTRQAEFRPKGQKYYTIIDWERDLRGPCNLIGQSWDEFMNDDACASLLAALRGEDVFPVEVSYRNNVPVKIVQVKA